MNTVRINIKSLIKMALLSSMIGILSGVASAVFLASLEFVTEKRVSHPSLLWLLPLGGMFVSFLYCKYGKNSIKGNNLILDEVIVEKESIPLRMGGLVYLGTIVTHLFGGSAGREGTAVQIGGSLAELVGKIFRVTKEERKILLISGISSGFGAVFGTPIAGAVFGMEVIGVRTMRYEAMLPCLVASFIGDLVTKSLGIHHANYPNILLPKLSMILVLKVIIAAILFAGVSVLFSQGTHRLKKLFSRFIKSPIIRSAVGGLIIILLVYIVGTRDYIGLGMPMILKAFEGPVFPAAFLLKILFTAITLGTGFQGGEVTPLFFIGATFGNFLSGIIHVSPEFLASLGFVGVFAGATNTPIACFIMGVELFGGECSVYFFLVCIISYVFSGTHSIYTSQKKDESMERTI